MEIKLCKGPASLLSCIFHMYAFKGRGGWYFHGLSKYVFFFECYNCMFISFIKKSMAILFSVD